MKVDFEVVASHLGCTPRAVQERLKKLRKMAAEHATSDPGTAAVGASVGPKTPTKGKTKSPTKAKTKASAAVAAADGDAVTPSPKKRKIATPKGAKGGETKGGTVEQATGVAETVGDGDGDGEAVYEGGMGTEEEMGEYAMGPEMSQLVKEEDLLGDGHDPLLYDAQIGLLPSEI